MEEKGGRKSVSVQSACNSLLLGGRDFEFYEP